MLIVAAPASIAAAIWRAAIEQGTPSDGSGTLSARIPGQTPRMPTSFLGAAATAAVAVPCELPPGKPGSPLTPEPTANSGWERSTAESTRASTGLVGVTGGGTSVGATMA